MEVWQIVCIVAGAVAAAVLLTLTSLGALAFRALLPRRKSKHGTDGGMDDERRLCAQAAEWAETVPHETLTLTVCDGVTLAATYLDNRADKTVVLVHGYRATRRSRLPDAMFYFERGYNVLAVDNRAHGESGGRYIGWGYLDSRDILEWVDLLCEKFGAEKIVLDGVSMGGATVLCTAFWPRRDAVQAIVADCSYTSLYDEFCCRMRLGWAVWPFFKGFVRLFAGYSVGRAAPIRAVQAGDVPTLFVHGDADRFVPYAMAGRLYAAAICDKRLLTTEGVGHALSRSLARDEYRQAIAELLSRTTEQNA